jgi:hypothetical protein
MSGSFRWSENSPDGKRLYRKKVVGTVEQYSDEDAARRTVAGLVSEINSGAHQANLSGPIRLPKANCT